MHLGDHVLFFVLVGLAAQMVDGALGIAFGLVASSVLLDMGVPPATLLVRHVRERCVLLAVGVLVMAISLYRIGGTLLAG